MEKAAAAATAGTSSSNASEKASLWSEAVAEVKKINDPERIKKWENTRKLIDSYLETF
jgi:hypothetical protein